MPRGGAAAVAATKQQVAAPPKVPASETSETERERGLAKTRAHMNVLPAWLARGDGGFVIVVNRHHWHNSNNIIGPGFIVRLVSLAQRLNNNNNGNTITSLRGGGAF